MYYYVLRLGLWRCLNHFRFLPASGSGVAPEPSLVITLPKTKKGKYTEAQALCLHMRTE